MCVHMIYIETVCLHVPKPFCLDFVMQFSQVSSQSSSPSYAQAAAYTPAPSMAAESVEATFLALEEKLVSKDSIIAELGEKLNQNMTDYADLVRSSYFLF